MTKNKIYFLCSIALLLIFVISVAIALYYITESPVIVPLGTIGLIAVVVVLAILITGEIEKNFESKWPSIQSKSGNLYKIDKTSISAQIKFDKDVVDINIDHNGIIDLDKIEMQIKSIDFSNLEEIIDDLNKESGFIETAKHPIPRSKFSINCVFLCDDTITYCFSVDDEAIPWGIDVEYSKGKIVGFEFVH
jgi:hypothetical protein